MGFEVHLRINHDCVLSSVASKLKRVFYVNCNNRVDHFTFESQLTIEEQKLFEDCLDYDNSTLIYSGINEQNHHNLLYSCQYGNRTHFLHFYESIINAFGTIFGLPKIGAGYEEYTYQAFDTSSQKSILANIGKETDFVIQSIKEFDLDDFFGNYTFSLTELFDSLTKYQMQILFDVFSHGYYQKPRDMKIESIANRYGKSRYSVEKVLRSAEKKLVDFLFPFLI